ncbi:MAG: serine/threonine-protein kinase [Planctomycetota bacterium]
MNADRFRRMEELFEAACEMAPEECRRYLDRECGSDHDLQRDVMNLLQRDEALPEAALDTGIARGIAREAAAVTDVTDGMPASIGQYRIVGVLGRGGMGVVYRAEQENPRRTVALKMIRPGLMGERALRRFEFEAQILGLLQHPGIAQIYEAGTEIAADGTTPSPYFAMELVEGQPVDEYARDQDLSTRARLELIAKVCDAVHHAHQQGVIHRDLKPGNILVPQVGAGVGQPKVLDFGVARAADSDPRTTTYRTTEGQLIGTLPYMSPEQVKGVSDLIDTRSDVYSLGVVLYELLSGRHPIDVGTRSLVEAAALIADHPPERISSSDGRFRGDIETIVQKCLEKEPDRRYTSAAEVAADIRRHLQNEPIAARPASRVYQLRKFVRRNRPIVVGTAAVIAVLLVAIYAERRQRLVAEDQEAKATKAKVEAQQQRVVAEQQEAAALRAKIDAETERTNALQAQAAAEAALDGSERVTRFLTELLAFANPSSLTRGDGSVRSELAEAERRLEEEFKDQPLIQARIRNALGETYLGLGEAPGARRQFELSLELRREHLGADHSETLRSQLGLANAILELSLYEEGLPVAEATFRACEKKYGLAHRETIAALGVVAVAHDNLHHTEVAQRMLEQHVQLATEHLGESNGSTVTANNNLAMHYQRVGRLDDAERLMRHVLALRRELLGSNHPNVATSLNNLGFLLNNRKRYAQAIPFLEEAFQIASDQLGADNSRTVLFGNNLGVSYYAVDRFDDARPFFETAVEVSTRKLGPDNAHTLLARANLAGLVRKEGDYESALRAWPDIVAGYRRAYPPKHPHIGVMLRLCALAQIDAELYEAAEASLLEAHGCVKVLGASHRLTQTVCETLGILYDKWGKPDEAQRWQGAPKSD